MEVDWSNPLDRAEFDQSLKEHKERRLSWTLIQKTLWVLQIFLVQFLLVVVLYGICAYNLVNNEQDLKTRKEEQIIKINHTGEVGGLNRTLTLIY